MSQQVFMEALVGPSSPVTSPSKTNKAEPQNGVDFSNVLRGFMRGTANEQTDSATSSGRSSGNRGAQWGSERPYPIPSISTKRSTTKKAGQPSPAIRPQVQSRPDAEPKSPGSRLEKSPETSGATIRNESLSRKAERLLERLQQQVRDVKEELQALPEKERPPLLDALRKAEGGSGFWSSLPDESALAALESGFDDPQSALNQSLTQALQMIETLPATDTQSILAAISASPELSALLGSDSMGQPLVETIVKAIGNGGEAGSKAEALLRELSAAAERRLKANGGQPESTLSESQNKPEEQLLNSGEPTQEAAAKKEEAASEAAAEKNSTDDSQINTQSAADQTTVTEVTAETESVPRQEKGSPRETSTAIEAEQPMSEGKPAEAVSPQITTASPNAPANRSAPLEAVLTEETLEQPLLGKQGGKAAPSQALKVSLEEGTALRQADSGGQSAFQQGNNGFGQPSTPGGLGTAQNAQTGTGTVAEQVKGSLFSQLVEKASLLKGPQQEKVLTMQLKPEFLGKVDMFLTSKDGAVTARILTDNPVVRDQLEAIAPQIRDHLAEQGINLQQLTVDISSRQPDDHSRQGRFSRDSGRRSRLGRAGGVENGNSADLTEAAPQAVHTDGKTIDITI